MILVVLDIVYKCTNCVHKEIYDFKFTSVVNLTFAKNSNDGYYKSMRSPVGLGYIAGRVTTCV